MSQSTKTSLALGLESPGAKIPTKVLGRVSVEVVDGKANSNVSLFEGANVLTMTELVVDGRWIVGVLNGVKKIEDGLNWVRETEVCVPGISVSFVKSDEPATVDTIALIKGISAVAVADLLARRKQNIGPDCSNVCRGVMSSIVKFGGGRVHTLGQLKNLAKKQFGKAFVRARLLRRARRNGWLSDRWESFLAELTGFDKPTSNLVKGGVNSAEVVKLPSPEKNVEEGSISPASQRANSQILDLKVLAIGALVICVFPPVLNRGVSIGFIIGEDPVAVGHLLALLFSWVALVYLWPGTLRPLWLRLKSTKKEDR